MPDRALAVIAKADFGGKRHLLELPFSVLIGAAIDE